MHDAFVLCSSGLLYTKGPQQLDIALGGHACFRSESARCPSGNEGSELHKNDQPMCVPTLMDSAWVAEHCSVSFYPVETSVRLQLTEKLA